jgi:L-methionine (R)-S-oxide reductase
MKPVKLSKVLEAVEMAHDEDDLPAVAPPPSPEDHKATFYKDLAGQLDELLGDQTDLIANMANTAALIYHLLPSINWAGFYLLRDNELVLGPFQGQPACSRIASGKGVCGTAAEQSKPIVVSNVHKFPGHIACDKASKSEIVVPLMRGSRVIGVLDLDSPELDRFDATDQAGLERLVGVLLKKSAATG